MHQVYEYAFTESLHNQQKFTVVSNANSTKGDSVSLQSFRVSLFRLFVPGVTRHNEKDFKLLDRDEREAEAGAATSNSLIEVGLGCRPAIPGFVIPTASSANAV